MINSIDIIHYKKLKNISLSFGPRINAISGVNGTCKSSILHILGNAFQKYTRNSEGIDTKALGIIKAINSRVNPKVENLTKGDKKYNNPANGTDGSLYKINIEGNEYKFRRHNSKMQSRFRLTLNYKRGERQALPLGMVIYLGLSRIVPIGELEDKTQEVRSCLPIKYQKEITAWYKDITQIPIDEFLVENSNSLKHRATFVSSNEGIDSNTISAGEDNLLIILTSLWSLKYHYESCTNEQYKCSTLLIDEIDATLHPSLQFKLYELMRDFSEKYKIQIFFTTHSLYLIEAILKNKDTVIYLKSSAAGGVSVMKNPDILKIEMFLNSKTRQDIYKDKKIPIFTEDKQARVFLKEILNYFSNENENFSRVFSHFHLVDINFGAENLRDLFNEKIISKSFLHAICILDGDKTDDSASNNLDNKIITLPGKGSPEFIAFSHFLFLYDCSDGCRFWNDSYIESQGWGLEWAESELKPSIQEQVNNYDRKKAKELFSNHEDFFRHILKDWIQNQNSSLNQFKGKLKILCKKLAPYYGLKKLD